jgi:hypothetical protein
MRSFERSALDSAEHRQHIERLQAADRLRSNPRERIGLQRRRMVARYSGFHAPEYI